MAAQPEQHGVGRSTRHDPHVATPPVTESGHHTRPRTAFDGSSRCPGSPTDIDESRDVDDLVDRVIHDLLRSGLRLNLVRPRIAAEGADLLAAATNDVDQALRRVRCAVLARVASREQQAWASRPGGTEQVGLSSETGDQANTARGESTQG